MTGVSNAKKLVIWHAIAPTYSAMTVIIMDMLPWIAQIKYLPLVHWHAAGLAPMTGVEDPPLDVIVTPNIHTMIIRIDPDSVTPDLAPITTDTGVVATRTPIEVTPDHSIDLPIAVSHNTKALVPTTTTATHLTADLHLIGILPEMTADLDINLRKQHYRPAQGPSSTSQASSWKHKDRRHKQVTIDDPLSEYYSSDDNDSDSEDELN